MGSGLYALLGPTWFASAIDSASWNQYAIESLVEACPMEVYLTRRDGTVATHGVDLTNATGVDTCRNYVDSSTPHLPSNVSTPVAFACRLSGMEEEMLEEAA